MTSPTNKWLLFLSVLILMLACDPQQPTYLSWAKTGGGSENLKYSALQQIDTTNYAKLGVAWVYHTENNDSTKFGPMECNPIIVEGVMYGVSPKLKLFAVNAATGKEIWTFNPADSASNKTWHRSSVNMNRGVAYWEKENDKRIIYTVGPIVFCVNATTGKLVPSFGTDGGISLVNGLDRDPTKLFVAPTSPVMAYKNLFFVSGLVGEETPGHIRAFDVLTGKQQWIFHTIPYPQDKGYETWDDTTAYRHMGSTNSWAGFSLDEKRGILFAPTGNPTNDFYGGNRTGMGLYGNSLLAIDAATGKLKWHFQTVHHDVWDMDLPAPPALVTVTHKGKKIDAVAQTTKTGFVFLLDRETGKPLFPVKEVSVNTATTLANEKLWPTQPMPVIPKPLVRQSFDSADLNDIVDASSYASIKKTFLNYGPSKIFTPPSVKGTIVLPGYDGGAEWGGPSFDPETQFLYVNTNEMAWLLNMVENKKNDKTLLTNYEAGKIIYTQNCMKCHGTEMQGGGNYPSIVGSDKKYTVSSFSQLVTTGKRMMPGNNALTKQEKTALASYVLNVKNAQQIKYTGDVSKLLPPQKTTYGFTGYNKFLTPEGYPAIRPPWGSLTAIDLKTGAHVWKIPFGEFEALKAKGIPATGRENYGGPVVTKGGLLFIGASADGKFRIIHKRTGKILREIDLPAPGVATPSIYEVNGKQFVVIACGGSKWGGKTSDAYVAFTLQ
ncbi:MAG: PQQ-binding-like beta-propeller repeat protein [Sediminibacterium sp.]